MKIERGEIEFRDLSFHYGKGGGVIDHFNLTIRAGEKVGLVGRSGAGKSTIFHLLLRYYDPTDGRILMWDVMNEPFDNHDLIDIHRVTPESMEAHLQHLRAMIALHVELTGSAWGAEILDDFRTWLPKFWLVKPKAAELGSLIKSLRQAA